MHSVYVLTDSTGKQSERRENILVLFQYGRTVHVCGQLLEACSLNTCRGNGRGRTESRIPLDSGTTEKGQGKEQPKEIRPATPIFSKHVFKLHASSLFCPDALKGALDGTSN